MSAPLSILGVIWIRETNITLTMSIFIIHYNHFSVEYTGPPARSVEEGAVDDIDLCLTVTEAREDHIFRRYYIDLISGSATG